MSACPSCSAPVRPGQADCDNCGHPLGAAGGQPKKRETEFELYRPSSKRKTEFGPASARPQPVRQNPHDPFAAAVVPDTAPAPGRDAAKRRTAIDVEPSPQGGQPPGWPGHSTTPLDPDDPFKAAVTGELHDAAPLPGGTHLAPNRPLAGLLITFTRSRNGEVFPLTRGRTLVGRDPDEERETVIRIADDSVSGTHCVVVARGTGVIVRDDMSSNGTEVKSAGDDDFVDIELEPRKLEDGDLLKLGDTVLLLRVFDADLVKSIWPSAGSQS